MVQAKLTLFGASAAIASAVVFVCRPVLIATVEAMCDPRLPITRVMLIGVWSLTAVFAILWLVTTTAVALHSRDKQASSEEQTSHDDAATGTTSA